MLQWRERSKSGGQDRERWGGWVEKVGENWRGWVPLPGRIPFGGKGVLPERRGPSCTSTLLKKTWIFSVGSLEIQVFFQEGGSKTGRQMFVRVRGKSKNTMHVCYTPSNFCKSCSLELCVTMAMLICFPLYSRLPSLKEAETPGKTG